MSPTDFTDSHRLFVRVCLNLPQISQILTDCLCEFVLISHRFHRFSQIVGVRLS